MFACGYLLCHRLINYLVVIFVPLTVLILNHSGGRDLSGNKRTSKEQTHDQKFTAGNEALRTSCRYGYPIRVIR